MGAISTAFLPILCIPKSDPSSRKANFWYYVVPNIMSPLNASFSSKNISTLYYFSKLMMKSDLCSGVPTIKEIWSQFIIPFFF